MTEAVEGSDTDPAAVSDDEVVLRRLSDDSPNMVYTDPLTNEKRPSSSSFAVKKDEDGLSVYRQAVLTRSGLSPADILAASSNLVVALDVADIRAIPPLDAREDSWPTDIPDPDHPRNAAHALIVGWDGLSKSQRKERQNSLVTARSLRFVYP